MPVLVLTGVEQKDALEKGSSDLCFLFQKNEVDEQLQALFFHSGVTTVARLAALAKDGDDLRGLMKDEFGIDSTAGLAQRVRATNVVISFNTASNRQVEQGKLEGELSALNLVKPIPVSEWVAMRNAWQAKYWKVDDDLIPARTYLERRAEEIEQGECKAESLTTVLTKDQDDPDTLIPVWSSTGSLSMRKGPQTIEEPKNPEQLRKRLKVAGMAVMLLGLKHTNREFLQGYNPQTTEDYLSYLLSEHCFYLQGKSAEGFTVSGPSWQQLLLYEFQIRKKAWQWILNGECGRFSEALARAWQDPLVKERFLTTPIALASSGTKRGPAGDDPHKPLEAKPKKAKGSGKGKGKGGGKSGKGGGGKSGSKAADRLGMSSKTPDGLNICYGYNDWNARCKNSKCKFEHVCGLCYGKHPLYACSPGSKAETQGGGSGRP